MSSNVVPAPGDSWQIKPNRLLSSSELGPLTAKNNRTGWVQLLGHLTIMALSGYLWATRREHWFLALPALGIYGFTFAAMFAPLHEGVHRTAFANPRLNEAVAWLAGLLSFYNSTFYRYFHIWHHRYTQIPDKDPELSDPQPTNGWEYLVEISGMTWWLGKIRLYLRLATGQLETYPFISENVRSSVIRSVRLQLLVYLLAIAISPIDFLLYWLLPLAVGQPFLRAILLAEHTGCSQDNDPLTNTRTTLTWGFLRFLMWNMPYHAEHHLYPGIPFHHLPQAHASLRPHLAHVDPGYIAVNYQIVKGFSPKNP